MNLLLSMIFIIVCLYVIYMCSTVSTVSIIPKDNKFISKPWGGYYNINCGVKCGAKYKIKVLVINPNECTSLQMHTHRTEIWSIAQGTVNMDYGGCEFPLKTGDTIKVLKGYKHRITNNGTIPVVITEVWLGDILEEEDIKRYKDKYGRI